MPPFALPDDQVWELAAFVRSLNAPASAVPVEGDAAAGEAIFFGKQGCSGCHAIMGRGGHLGPDLSNIGAAPQARRDSRSDRESQGGGHSGIPAGADRGREGRAAARSRPARIELVVAGARRERKPAPAARRRDAEGAVSEPVVDARRASIGARDAKSAGLPLSPHARAGRRELRLLLIAAARARSGRAGRATRTCERARIKTGSATSAITRPPA